MITVEAVFQAMPPDTPHRFYLNDYRPDGQKIHLYDDDSHLVAEMIEAIRAGGRQYVATNSRHRAKVLKAAIEREFGESVKLMLVTSEETGNEEVLKAFGKGGRATIEKGKEADFTILESDPYKVDPAKLGIKA